MSEDLELRSVDFELRSFDEETRTVRGLAIPYEDSVDTGSYVERIQRGAFADAEPGDPLYFDHAHMRGEAPIGLITETRSTDAGLEIAARISDTPKGNEVHTLLKDGVLRKFSAAFRSIKHRVEADGTVVREKAKLFEVSVTPNPIYGNASVMSVRSQAEHQNNKEESNMSEETVYAPESDVAELRSAFSDLERKFTVLNEGGHSNTEQSGMQYRSGGELLKAVYNGDESAMVELRAYTGAATSDSVVKAAWIDRGLKLAEVNRKAFNLFNHKPLGPGMTIEYPVVSSVSGSVAVQAAEGDDLTYNEVVLTTATAPRKTYGGYTSLSAQVIKNSTVNYLETALDHLARNYGRTTNTAVATAATGASGVNTGTGLTLSSSTAAQWLNFVLEGSAAIEDNGLGARAEFMWVSRDVFAKLAAFVDSAGRPMFVLNADGTNSIGNANLVTISGSIAGMPIVVDQGLSAKTAFMGAAEAVEIYEEAGAPYAKSAENIINLTSDFSLSGDMVIAVPNPKALFKVTVA